MVKKKVKKSGPGVHFLLPPPSLPEMWTELNKKKIFKLLGSDRDYKVYF